MYVCFFGQPANLNSNQVTKSNYQRSTFMYFRDAGVGGSGGSNCPHPQFLADQLTLFQPEGADNAHHINTAPRPLPDFWTVRRLCIFMVQLECPF